MENLTVLSHVPSHVLIVRLLQGKLSLIAHTESGPNVMPDYLILAL